MQTDNKDNIIRHLKTSEMIEDKEYYKYVFKKTERIYFALIYIFNNKDYIKDSTIEESIKDVLKETHVAVIGTLSMNRSELAQNVSKICLKYITLQSYIRIASASSTISQEHVDIFNHEIESVIRLLRTYDTVPLIQSEAGMGVSVITKTKDSVRHSTINQGKETLRPLENVMDRKGQIISIIEDKKSVTIKDISDVIKDFSEKTIQRDLMTLIDEQKVIKEGERRWSRYRLAA